MKELLFAFGTQAKENNKYRGMNGRIIEEKEGSAIGRYIRNIADIIQKCNDRRIADIMLNRSYIRSTADITKLYEIAWALFPVMKLVVIYESFQ